MPSLREELSAALSDRYEVLTEVGRGGFATVFEARDRKHDSRVALKVLRPELASAPGSTRFTQEVRITARLQHPNILPLLDSGVAGGLPWYVMPFVEGESLAAHLAREPQLAIDAAVDLIAEIADGLAYAHAQGVVHRDIKPENILISHGHGILSDFGIAQALDATGAERLTDSGIALGTVSYMSPEQAAGERVDARSDIYALGCVLYEALAGSPPFSGPTAQTVMARHAVDPPPSIRSVRSTVPPALEGVVLKALAKAPADRYQAAAEFRDAVRRAMRAPTAAAPAARPRLRALRIGGGMAAAMAVGAALYAWQSRPGETTLDPNRVVVFPLVLPDDWPGSKATGEDVATMIGSALDGAAPLRLIDGWQLLNPAERDSARLITLPRAVTLARGARARYALTGRVALRGDSADVTLLLHDVAGDSTIARPSARASIGDAWRGGLAATTALLPRLIPTGVPDVAAQWASRSPGAVAPFLLGESAFRRARTNEAQRHFLKAVEVDSTFGLAAIRGAQAASWNHNHTAAARLIDVALRSPLSPAHHAFAVGYRYFLAGLPDSALSALRESLAADSSRAFVWMQIGEVYAHLQPMRGPTDSLQADALDRAIRLDSTASNALYHLIEVRLRQGDTARAAPLVRRFLAAQPDTMLAHEIELMDACVRRGPGREPWSGAERNRPGALLGASASLLAAGGNWPCAERGFAALLVSDTAATTEADTRRWYALIGLQGIHLGRGDTLLARRAIEEYIARYGFGNSLYLWDAANVGAFQPEANGVVRQDTLAGGASVRGCEFALRCWLVASTLVAHGNPAAAQSIARGIPGLPPEPGSIDHATLGLSVDARVSLARGDTADATGKLRQLLGMPRPNPTLWWHQAAPFVGERLALARVMLARAEYREALDLLQVFDARSIVSAPLFPLSLTLRADAAERLGDNAAAAAFRARLARVHGRNQVAQSR